VEIIAGLNLRIYSSATEAFNELDIPHYTRKELRAKITAWAEEFSDYQDRING